MSETTRWIGCYDLQWGEGMLVPDAYSHPAKFSHGLIRRIYEYLFETGRVKKGALVIDPFGGVACGGIIGASMGVRWLGCELEPKFVALAEANFALHQRTWKLSGDPLPRIVQGDSRKLRAVLAPYLCQQPEATVSSPPFIDQMASHDNFSAPHDTGKRMATDYDTAYGATTGQLGAMPAGEAPAAIVSSPPFCDGGMGDGRPHGGMATKPSRMGHVLGGLTAYGDTEGQLAQMREGGIAEAMRSSPPFSPPGNQPTSQGQGVRQDYRDGKLTAETPLSDYGDTPGQLGAMPMGDARMASPPFESSDNRGAAKMEADYFVRQDGTPFGEGRSVRGTNPQVGALEGDTFWAAARKIVEECYLILKPGAVAVWVCKDFIRNKKRVPFSSDWCRLCESCGFRLVEWIQASLVKEVPEPDLFSEVQTRRKERKIGRASCRERV